MYCYLKWLYIHTYIYTYVYTYIYNLPCWFISILELVNRCLDLWFENTFIIIFSIAHIVVFRYILSHNYESLKCYCLIWRHLSERQRWRLLAWPFLGNKFSKYKVSAMSLEKKKIDTITLKNLISLQDTDFLDKFST